MGHNQDTCRNCGKPRGEHKSVGKNCPRGRKYRGVGCIDFADTVFELKKAYKPKFTIGEDMV